MKRESMPYARVVCLAVACLFALPLIATAQSICASVPAAASGGVSFGTVVAGQVYSYQASGCIQRSFDPDFADPDGTEFTNGCSSFYQTELAPADATCPGLRLFSLVGKIDGGSCIQLGKSGTFTASSSGTLVLYCNDNVYGDNSGAWDVCITPVSQVCSDVPANAAAGVSFGQVAAGQTYTYHATGCAGHNIGTGASAHTSDPDGNVYSNNCTSFVGNFTYTGSFTCPGFVAFSLVGKIDGGACIQLGKDGSFVAPSSGQLVLYLNDDNYSDNSGSWSVCLSSVQQIVTNTGCG